MLPYFLGPLRGGGPEAQMLLAQRCEEAALDVPFVFHPCVVDGPVGSVWDRVATFPAQVRP